MRCKKRCFALFGVLFVLVFALGFVQAQSNSSESVVDSALSCIEDKAANGSCSNFGLEDKIFSSLSAGQCVNELDNSSNNNCFGVGGCNPKHTAQSILALDRAGKDTSDYVNWLRSTNTTASGLNWYMQVDSQKKTSCTIKDLSGTTYQVSIGEEKNISLGNTQGCFDVSDNGYWLEIDSSCQGQEFEVSCQDGFSTSLLFQKQGSSQVFVTEEIHTASAGGAVVEKAESSLCLSKGGTCSYEDTLWGVLALKQKGYDISDYLPYLTAFAEDNEEHIPESFLYMFTSGKDHRSELLLGQKADRYWSESGNRFYDTAVALMPFGGESLDAKSNSIDWLKDKQGSSGCWNQESIADTGFLLYSIWPSELPSISLDSGGGGGGGPSNDTDGGTGLQDCEANGNYCVNEIVCSEQEGSQLDAFSCDGFGKVCCDTPAPNKSCEELGGEICSSGKTCDGAPDSSASDVGIGETCCIGSCVEESNQTENTCEPNGGNCRIGGCRGEETSSSLYDCGSSGGTCCMPPEDEGGGGFGVWIFVLIALIVLTILAIIFREKLKKIYLRFKSKGHSRSGKRPPGMPPGKPPGKPPQGPGRPPMKRPPVKKKRPSPPPGKKKEIDEVMGKLKKMGS